MKKVLWGIIGAAVLVIILVAAISSVGSPSSSAAQPSFAQLAQKRFDDIKSSVAELSDIHCFDSSCTGVAYFNFKTLPSEAETIIRGNAAAFSKFAMDNGVGSHVTIFAQLNGKDLFHCAAADGQVTGCSN